jgi:hypothetical protein
MFDAVNTAIQQKEELGVFHERALKQFVPNRQLSKLRVDKY